MAIARKSRAIASPVSKLRGDLVFLVLEQEPVVDDRGRHARFEGAPYEARLKGCCYKKSKNRPNNPSPNTNRVF